MNRSNIHKETTITETTITKDACEDLKSNCKKGLFQNEVDYRVIFPDFAGRNITADLSHRYRADIISFISGRVYILEYKKFDETNRNRNMWGVLWLLDEDRKKLEQAIEQNILNINGEVIQIACVMNPQKVNEAHVAKMVERWLQESCGNRCPRIMNGNYSSVLHAYKEYVEEDEDVEGWQSVILNRKHYMTLVARKKLLGT